MKLNLRVLFFPLLLSCALGACGDDGTSSGDGDGDHSVPCAELNEAQCEARNLDDVGEEHACHPISGRKLCDSADLEENPFEFVVCGEGGDGDGTLVTCASEPETDEPYEFPNTGTPAAWEQISCSRDVCESNGGGAGGEGGAHHEDLTGTGTACSPAEACIGEATGCTECPSTKLCIVRIVNGAGVNLAGAAGESVTFLDHRCVEVPNACSGATCTCEESELCGHGDCLGALPQEYDGLGNLEEVSEGGLFCSEYDG